MIKKYFTRYFIETANAVGNRKDIENGKILGLKFNFGSNEISLYDRKEGLFVDSYIPEESLEKAKEKAETLVENILNLVDFSTSSASSPPLFISVYDASPNLKEREFEQVFYIPMRERNIITINNEIFEEVFEVINQNKDERLVRAISWLRKGYLEPKHVDKFIAFWTGLEAINELIADKFNIPTGKRKSKCPKCGFQLGPIAIGIEKLFINEMEIDKSLFKKIRATRGKLLHGGGPIDDEFIEKIKEYNSLLKKALIRGIGKLLQMDNGTIEKITQQKSKRYNEKLRIVVRATLTELTPPKLDEFEKQPRIDLTNLDLLERTVSEDGKLNLSISPQFKSKNATFKLLSLELWGEDNTGIDYAKVIKIN